MQTETKMNVLWGAKAIGEKLGVNTRKAFYLLETRKIPAKKIGGQWTAEENQLREHFTGKVKPEVEA